MFYFSRTYFVPVMNYFFNSLNNTKLPLSSARRLDKENFSSTCASPYQPLIVEQKTGNKLEGDNKTVTEIQLILVVSNLRTSIQKFKKTDKKTEKTCTWD